MKQPQCVSLRLILTTLIWCVIICGVIHREQEECAKLHFSTLFSLVELEMEIDGVFVLLNPAINTVQVKMTQIIFNRSSVICFSATFWFWEHLQI